MVVDQKRNYSISTKYGQHSNLFNGSMVFKYLSCMLVTDGLFTARHPNCFPMPHIESFSKCLWL